MSELPRTEDLPRTSNGLDQAQVEEAFARFGDRVRELESVAADLRAELRALRAERPSGGYSPASFGDEEWPYEPAGPSTDWLATIPPPVARALAVPRLLVEALFLLAVGLLAGLADLATGWIVGLMAAAWALVALSEWTAASRRARWRLEEIPSALPPGSDDESTGPWSMPVVEATVVEGPDDSESHTVMTSLPEPLPAEEPVEVDEADAAEEAAEDEVAGGRGWRFWRRKPHDETADPWER